MEELTDYYVNRLGCALWLDQGGCRLFRYGNLVVGFCRGDKADTEGLVTFVYPRREQVDSMHRILAESAQAPPKDNPDYRIYHFYAKDPEGRNVEFQYFWDDGILPPVSD